MRATKIIGLVILMVSSGFLAACGRIRQEKSAAEVDAVLELALDPSQVTPGAGRLIFTLTDGQGRPITAATLSVEGNMTHAGMVPVFAQAKADQAGRYVVPFEWTMSGDWLLTVQVSLTDGQQFSQQFPVTVQ